MGECALCGLEFGPGVFRTRHRLRCHKRPGNFYRAAVSRNGAFIEGPAQSGPFFLPECDRVSPASRGTGRETAGSPSQLNRRSRSAACRRPTRVPTAIGGVGIARRSMWIREAGSSRSMPSSARVIPRPRHRFPGPRSSACAGQAVAASSHHRRDALLHGRGTQEHRSRNAVRLGHHVRAVVHPVGEVHVQVRGRAEHHARPGRRAAERMRGGIDGAEIRLGLDDPRDDRGRRSRVNDERCSRPGRGRPPPSDARTIRAAGSATGESPRRTVEPAPPRWRPELAAPLRR